MSIRTALASAIHEEFSKCKGAHLTHEARFHTGKKFASVMSSLQYTHLKTPKDIKEKHVKAYVAFRKMQNASIRTLQNEMSHLRTLLFVCGKKELASAPEISNKSLKISGASRVGTKVSITDEDLCRVCEESKRQRRPGMGCLLMLERWLGLRTNEAIHARADTLTRWKRELMETRTITVISGSKGGRPRTVSIKYLDQAMTAIDDAISVASEQGGFLVARRNRKPVGGLHRARCIYHAWMWRMGVQSHCARYAFAQMNFKAYCNEGYLIREALIRVSSDLGHGSGRGRWVKSVYLRTAKLNTSGDSSERASKLA